MKRMRNWFLFIILVLLWSLNWTVMKSGLKYVDPLNFVLHRLIFSALALGPSLLIFRNKIPKDSRSLVMLFFSGVIWTLAELSINIGLTYETSGVSAIITYTQPLFVFCMAVPFLKEKTNVSKLMGLFIGFSGVFVLSLSSLSIETLTASLYFLLLGAFLVAVSVIFYKKFITHIEPLIASVVQLSVGAFLLGLMNLAFGDFYWPLSIDYLFIVLYSSIGTLSVALTIWLYLLREEDATTLSSSSLIVPLVAFIFGWVLLVEPVELKSILGAILIAIGAYLVNRPTKKSL